jgi:hypothetical protein
MGPGTRIGHFTLTRNLDIMRLEEKASIGQWNWITGYARGGPAYRAETSRISKLVLRRHAAVTSRHYLDCTNSIEVGEFSTVAGLRSQFLTHGIDLHYSIQRSRPIFIGRFCFVGTNCVILGGSVLPDYSVLGAKSLLNKIYYETRSLYAGVPARKVKDLPPTSAYFLRTDGFVL